MARTEWLRTFVAIYRAESITEAARQRSISQPAASQQLAALERSVGGPLFVRASTGMTPTVRGRELYGEVVDPLDRLEAVMNDLDAGSLTVRSAAVRLGANAEYFASEAVARLAPLGIAVNARFGDDAELLQLLALGELDVAIVSSTPSSRGISSRWIGMKRFVLVGAPELSPETGFDSLDRLGAWLEDRPWVAYSHDLPITRRFWRDELGRSFAGDLRLVAPDLRAVAAAVESGIGISILPTFVCGDAMRRGAIRELYPVSDLIPGEPWIACVRGEEIGRPAVAEILQALGQRGDAAAV